MVVGVFGGGGAMEVTLQYSDPQSISENRMIKVRLRCGRGTAGLKGLRGGGVYVSLEMNCNGSSCYTKMLVNNR